MRTIRKIFVLLALFIPFMGYGQFYVTGDDPGRLKWNYIDTDNFRVIYPKGCDSLAHEYAFKLEKYKIPVSRTTGYAAGHGDGRLMPAVLHTYNGANGSVAWAPKRMDLFTLPTAYDPEPMPWSTMLTVHEGRHVTQMQFGMTNVQRPFTYVFGEMWNILVSLLYPGMPFIEGDAVVAETSLTPSGRGRTADFLNYYRVAFDQGDYRRWDKWQFESQKHYTPDHYALGYMTLSGIRYLYDYPDIMKDAYNMASRKIFNFYPINTVASQKSGKKFNDMFKEVCDTMQVMWSRDYQERAPFIYSEEVSNPSTVYTNYSHTTTLGNDIYTVKSGYQHTPTLIKIDEQGNETRISSMAYQMSDLVPMEEGCLIWSEDVPDKRWGMKSDSKIRVISPKKGKKTPIRFNAFGNDNGPVYNPSVSEKLHVAAAQYLPEGGTALWRNGISIPAPDSLQLVETAWIGNTIYVTAISDNGFGIYALDNEEATARHLRLTMGRKVWTVVLEPQPVKITDFKSHGNELMFTSDRTGVNELYHLNPETGELRQKTVTKYGAQDFAYNGEYLYYSAPTLNGMRIYRTPVDSLIDRKVDYTEKYKYVIADCLAEQERQKAIESGLLEAVDNDIEVNISKPKRYRKAAHMFNIHSWAPVYVNVDNIMNMSYDYIFQAASLGASAIMQNRLSTGVGEFGYSAHKDPYDKSKWRHSGHFKYTYSGLYPIIEAQVDFNDRGTRQYNVKAIKSGENVSIGLYSNELDSPYFEGRLSTYIPFNFSSGGWYKGFIPKLTYRITNDMFNTSVTILEENTTGTYPGNPPFVSITEGKNSFRHYLSGSLRAYTMLSTPSSAVYPRWGIGAEVGVIGSLESSNILSPMGYGYLYGYIPGITREQGLKLSVMHQQKLNKESFFSQPAVSILPRGLASTPSLATYMSVRNPSITKVSADYAIPIYIGDISIWDGFFYIKRLCLTPHADYTRAGTYNLLSVGSALTIDLSGIIWIGWPVSIGATYSYSGIADYNNVKSQFGLDMSPHYVGAIFNVSF